MAVIMTMGNDYGPQYKLGVHSMHSIHTHIHICNVDNIYMYWQPLDRMKIGQTAMNYICMHASGFYVLNTLRPRQNGCHFLDNIFKWIFLIENVWILFEIKISLKFVPRGPINNIPTLVKIMTWCRPSDKPLSEPMSVSLLTHICVTQWVNSTWPSNALSPYYIIDLC